MSYEHGHSIQFDLDHLSQYENVIELEEKKIELDEVYAKAEAFDEISITLNYRDTPIISKLHNIYSIVHGVDKQ